jgi:hypothetical protein
MKAHLAIASVLLVTCCGCYPHRTLDPKFTKIESPFEHSSIRAISPPIYLCVQLNDTREDIWNYKPDMFSASLTSSGGLRYPLSLSPMGSDNNTEENAHGLGRNDFWLTYYFGVMDPSSPNNELSDIPSDGYTLSIRFIGPSGAKPFVAHIKRRVTVDFIKVWDH